MSGPGTGDTGRRCPRCDCPDGHEQCDHCKVCPHANSCPHAPSELGPARADALFVGQDTIGDFILRVPKPEFLVSLCEDDGTLIVGIRPDGSIATGPTYQPGAAAREFWAAVTRAAQAANPWGQQ